MQRTVSLAVALAASFASPVFAQCPNDECTGAILVTTGLNGPFDTSCATTSAPAWPCALGGNDLWFSYTHTLPTGPVTANTCTGSNYDTALEVFDGSCTSLLSLVCNDDSCGLRSALTWTATQNTTYYIRVGGFNGATGMFQLEINPPPPCPNADECVNAIPAVVGRNGPYNTACATTSAPAWPCALGGNDLWFVYRHNGWDGVVEANTCSGSLYDTALEVFSGSCTALTSIICNDDSCGLQSSVSWSAVRGTTYYIRVGGFNASTGDFVLTIRVAGSFTSINPGCGGTTLSASSSAASGLPEIGSTLTFSVTPAAGAAQAMWLGLAQTPVQLCPGCSLCCTMTVLLPPGASTNVPVPNSPALCGACICVQGTDVFVPPGPGCNFGAFSFTLSDCVQVLIGC